VLVSTPPVAVGSAGETGFSVRDGRSVLLVLGIGLKVIPFCSVVAGFSCASAIVADVVSASALRPINRVQRSDMRATPECVAFHQANPGNASAFHHEEKETIRRSVIKRHDPRRVGAKIAKLRKQLTRRMDCAHRLFPEQALF
jgi:hypothetical protein